MAEKNMNEDVEDTIQIIRMMEEPSLCELGQRIGYKNMAHILDGFLSNYPPDVFVPTLHLDEIVIDGASPGVRAIEFLSRGQALML